MLEYTNKDATYRTVQATSMYLSVSKHRLFSLLHRREGTKASGDNKYERQIMRDGGDTKKG